MLQTFLVYLIVAVAAAWVVWSFAPKSWRPRRKALGGAPAKGCGPDCGCGD